MLAQKFNVGADCALEFIEATLAVYRSLPGPRRSKQLDFRLVRP